ncbi:hypothetical protein ACLB2K_027719 [Fragaria x ananassa]
MIIGQCLYMENFLRSKELWDLIENRIPTATQGAQQSVTFSSVVAERGQQTEAQRKQAEEQCQRIEKMKLKDLKVKNYLFQAIERSIMETILNRESAKSIWDSMRQKYQGTSRVKRAYRQALRKEFEVLQMREGEKVDEFFKACRYAFFTLLVP